MLELMVPECCDYILAVGRGNGSMISWRLTYRFASRKRAEHGMVHDFKISELISNNTYPFSMPGLLSLCKQCQLLGTKPSSTWASKGHSHRNCYYCGFYKSTLEVNAPFKVKSRTSGRPYFLCHELAKFIYYVLK